MTRRFSYRDGDPTEDKDVELSRDGATLTTSKGKPGKLKKAEKTHPTEEKARKAEEKAAADLLAAHFVEVTSGAVVENRGGYLTYERPYQETRTEYWQAKITGSTIHLRMGYDRGYEGAYTRKEKQASAEEAQKVLAGYVADRIANGWRQT